MSPFLRRRLAPLAGLFAAILLAATASAQTPPLRLALELNASSAGKGVHDASLSVSRRVAVHVTQQLESLGYEVTRVKSASTAASSGRFHAAVRLDVVARPLALVRDARLYDKRPAPDPHPSVMYETARTLVTDRSESVEAWGRWKVWDGMSSKAVEHGKVASVLPKEQAQGAGRSELDDEESVSRVFADSAGKWISEALEVTTAAR